MDFIDDSSKPFLLVVGKKPGYCSGSFAKKNLDPIPGIGGSGSVPVTLVLQLMRFC
jgi:hypothetical protein